MNLKGEDERYITITLNEGYSNKPAYYDLEKNEWVILNVPQDAIMMGVNNAGDVYYSTPYMGLMRNSFIVPAGTTKPIDFREWLLDRTDGLIDLTEYFEYEYEGYDPVTWDEVMLKETITGAVMFSVDDKRIVSKFQAPDGSGLVTYVVDLTDMTNVDEIKDANEQFAIYPNPVEDVLNIEGDFAKFTIVNLSGATVLSSTTNNVNVSELPTGVYLLNIESADGKKTTRTMMKK